MLLKEKEFVLFVIGKKIFLWQWTCMPCIVNLISLPEPKNVPPKITNRQQDKLGSKINFTIPLSHELVALNSFVNGLQWQDEIFVAYYFKLVSLLLASILSSLAKNRKTKKKGSN